MSEKSLLARAETCAILYDDGQFGTTEEKQAIRDEIRKFRQVQYSSHHFQFETEAGIIMAALIDGNEQARLLNDLEARATISQWSLWLDVIKDVRNGKDLKLIV